MITRLRKNFDDTTGKEYNKGNEFQYKEKKDEIDISMFVVVSL